MTKVLEGLSNTAIVGIYNQVSEKHVKEFKNKATAIARTTEALAKAGKTVKMEGSNITLVEKPAPARRKAEVNDSRIIKVLVEKNPKIQAKAKERFSAYKDGMTVSDFAAALASMGYRPTQALKEIAWDSERKFITVEEVTVSNPDPTPEASAPVVGG